jgi:hypothetical protein
MSVRLMTVVLSVGLGAPLLAQQTVVSPLPAQVALAPRAVVVTELRRAVRPALASASTQGSRAIDSLAALLDSSDYRVRAEGVAGLSVVPVESIPNTVAAQLMTLLDREGSASASTAVSGQSATSDAAAEQYGEYIIALTDLVLSFKDARATRGMALIGIQTSREAQQFVAAQGASVLPLLDSVYAGSAATAPGVVKTWAYVLGQRARPLAHADSVHVVSRLLTTGPAHPVAFASAARIAGLVDAAASLEAVGSATSDPIIRSVTHDAAAQLRVVRQQQPTAVRVHQMGFLLETLCADPAADRTRCGAVNDSLAAIRQGGASAATQQRLGKVAGQLSGAGALTGHQALILQDAAHEISTRRVIAAPPR